MTQLNNTEPEEIILIADFTPVDKETANSLLEYFADHETLEIDSFLGTSSISVIILTGLNGLKSVLRYFIDRRTSLKDASVKIGKEEISLTGYSIQEVEKFLGSDSVEKILKEMKKGEQN